MDFSSMFSANTLLRIEEILAACCAITGEGAFSNNLSSSAETNRHNFIKFTTHSESWKQYTCRENNNTKFNSETYEPQNKHPNNRSINLRGDILPNADVLHTTWFKVGSHAPLNTASTISNLS